MLLKYHGSPFPAGDAWMKNNCKTLLYIVLYSEKISPSCAAGCYYKKKKTTTVAFDGLDLFDLIWFLVTKEKKKSLGFSTVRYRETLG